MSSQSRFLKAIRREPVDVTPIWLMRQAGRYLPEYQRSRAQAGSFMKLCQTPALAAEVTLQPLERYPLDAGIIFSDILVIPDALGLALEVVEGKGPHFKQPLSGADIKRLPRLDCARLTYVYDAIRLVCKTLGGRIPLIGFAGSPFTLAVYMMQGESVPHFPKAQALLKEDPTLMHHLLSLLADGVTAHLIEQAKAGAQAVMIFDTWGGVLEAEHYMTFSLDYIQRVMTAFKHSAMQHIPVIVFSKGVHRFIEAIAVTGCDVVSLDAGISLQEARQRLGNRVALQGNLDPAYLAADAVTLRREVLRVLDAYGHGSGHIFNLGHGVPKTTSPEKVAILIDAVHELSAPYHHRRAT
jgi:uroporphyrinogen decarboxylase